MADDAEINAATKPGKDQKNNPYENRSGRAIFFRHAKQSRTVVPQRFGRSRADFRGQFRSLGLTLV